MDLFINETGGRVWVTSQKSDLNLIKTKDKIGFVILLSNHKQAIINKYIFDYFKIFQFEFLTIIFVFSQTFVMFLSI